MGRCVDIDQYGMLLGGTEIWRIDVEYVENNVSLSDKENNKHKITNTYIWKWNDQEKVNYPLYTELKQISANNQKYNSYSYEIK